ncbi:hypothetical protein EJ06DRAFT_532633 [Trichodelitschia bisporula]|uniref:Uncharacterized protein n=1 Tax=Trichodelitschia bisporula TaxID=703511 RepID=A0A6G1HP41_9PEZI|nr:hypothetical protein EJ06DRAFT_532633 [Trichodelitschia bisporula]
MSVRYVPRGKQLAIVPYQKQLCWPALSKILRPRAKLYHSHAKLCLDEEIHGPDAACKDDPDGAAHPDR